jgi:hypothetical protein
MTFHAWGTAYELLLLLILAIAFSGVAMDTTIPNFSGSVQSKWYSRDPSIRCTIRWASGNPRQMRDVRHQTGLAPSPYPSSLCRCQETSRAWTREDVATRQSSAMDCPDVEHYVGPFGDGVALHFRGGHRPVEGQRNWRMAESKCLLHHGLQVRKFADVGLFHCWFRAENRPKLWLI